MTMKFSYTWDDQNRIPGWVPECCLNMKEFNPTTEMIMIVHDLVDHGIIASGDFSQKGESIALGSLKWRSGMEFVENHKFIPPENFHLYELGFNACKKRFPNGIVIPEESKNLLKNLKHQARKIWYHRADKSSFRKFDFDAKIDGRIVKIMPVCEEFW